MNVVLIEGSVLMGSVYVLLVMKGCVVNLKSNVLIDVVVEALVFMAIATVNLASAALTVLKT